MTEDIDKAALLAALRKELAFVEFLDDLMDWGTRQHAERNSPLDD
jgi:hypothetical protein